ncbi:hypothetical protein F7D08_0369 [Bifidobacterium cebidarum]|uniref:Uncharacterized protein n=1 Tax=Bifidobacterium cebidarum TaxID=2650773 RepID=A0A6I1GJ19_9BIFI|nr:hypothetical protein F7D08_0369 [Bifidobacterium cebidarum]
MLKIRHYDYIIIDAAASNHTERGNNVTPTP